MAASPSQFLYKYTAHEYAHNIVNNGDIWLGTLHGYQKEEDLGNEVGDKEEGVLRRGLNVERYSLEQDHQDKEFIEENFSKVISGFRGAKDVILDKVSFVQNVQTPNCYVYSTSLSTKNHERKLEVFGDTCVVIKDPYLFFSSIVKQLWKEISKYSRCFPVQYYNRDVHYSEVHPDFAAFVKPTLYSWQDESRVVLFPKPEFLPIKPHLIRVPDLVGSCEIYKG